MAHFTKSRLETPKDFNFAKDVVGYWAAKDPESMAMYWVSQDLSETRILKYSHLPLLHGFHCAPPYCLGIVIIVSACPAETDRGPSPH